MFIYKFKDLPLIFIFNEKCACTTIKNMINDIDHLYDTEKYFDVHRHQFSPEVFFDIFLQPLRNIANRAPIEAKC